MIVDVLSKRFKTYCDRIAGQSLAQIKTSDIQKKLDSLSENVSSCEVIQDHLDELHNEETAKAEEREVEEHRLANEELGNV